MKQACGKEKVQIVIVLFDSLFSALVLARFMTSRRLGEQRDRSQPYGQSIQRPDGAACYQRSDRALQQASHTENELRY